MSEEPPAGDPHTRTRNAQLNLEAYAREPHAEYWMKLSPWYNDNELRTPLSIRFGRLYRIRSDLDIHVCIIIALQVVYLQRVHTNEM